MGETLKILRSDCYQCEKDGEEFFVQLFPALGMIYVKTDSYTQIFQTEIKDSNEDLLKSLRTLDLEESALAYKEGVVNKGKFIRSVESLSKNPKYKLSKEDLKKLDHFIASRLHIEPATVRMQMILENYGHISEIVEFEDPRPELLKSYTHMKEFMSHILTEKG